MGIRHRIYEDYLKKSRLPQYKAVLEKAFNNGYQMMGIYDYYCYLRENNGMIPGDKLLVNRHDIDTSPKVAKKMFEIEKEVYGETGTATYYFRESTIDCKLIKDIEEFGYETGYHYEEIATVEKKKKYKNLEEIKKNLVVPREKFIDDLNWFRRMTGSKSLSVASHGDFINVKYQYQNFNILTDEKTREQAGIIVEAYDDYINQYVIDRYADHELLTEFREKVEEGIQGACPCIMILTHPRNWEVDIKANTRENLVRLVEGMRYRKNRKD